MNEEYQFGFEVPRIIGEIHTVLRQNSPSLAQTVQWCNVAEELITFKVINNNHGPLPFIESLNIPTYFKYKLHKVVADTATLVRNTIRYRHAHSYGTYILGNRIIVVDYGDLRFGRIAMLEQEIVELKRKLGQCEEILYD